jgi:hypothetical protein
MFRANVYEIFGLGLHDVVVLGASEEPEAAICDG